MCSEPPWWDRGAESSRSCRCGISAPSLSLPSSSISSDPSAPHHWAAPAAAGYGPEVSLCLHRPRSGGGCSGNLGVFWPFSASHFTCFLQLQNNFLSVSDKCTEFVSQVEGMDPGLFLDTSARFCYRHLWRKVSLCHIQKMPLWSRLLSFFLWFLVSLFFSSVVNISAFAVKIAVYFETVFRDFHPRELVAALCSSVLPCNRTNLCGRVTIPIFVNQLQQIALIDSP